MNFDKLNADLLATGKDVVFDRGGLSYLILSLLDLSNVGDISFDKFDQDDIMIALSELYESREYDDDDVDVDEEVKLNKDSSLAQIQGMVYKMHTLETAPKKRVPSSFKFL